MSALENYRLSALRAAELLSKRTPLSPAAGLPLRYDPLAGCRAAALTKLKQTGAQPHG